MPSGVKKGVRTYRMLIGGEWVESAGKKTFAV